MTVAARLSGVGTFSAFEFDDNTNTSFSISVGSIVFSNEFDENTSTTLSGAQRMSATSSGGVIVLDSINEIDPFGEISTDGLQLHLDSVDSNITSESTPQGQQDFTTSGTFTVPTGVTQVSAVVVGGGGGGAGSANPDETGGGGGGGALAYVNAISTTPGESLTVTVGSGGNGGGDGGGNGTGGGSSSVSRGVTTLVQANGGNGGQHRGNGGAGGTVATGTGGSGGVGGDGSDRNNNDGGGGGGAGGYSGNGGAGAAFNDGGGGSAGSGGAAGGGGSGTSNAARGGGGVGILGEGTSGAASADGASGNGGSGGANGTFNGGLYGGGGAGAAGGASGGSGANGAVRIIWGPGRSYPSTLTTDQSAGATKYFWEDLSGNNRDATFENVSTNPVSGNFINFDGTDDYAACDGEGTGASSYLGISGTGARTSIVFFKLDSNTITAQTRLLAWGLPGTNGAKWAMELNTANQINIGVTGGSRQTNTTYDFSKWNMIAATYPGGVGDTTDIRIWLNGIEQTDLGGTTQTVNTDTTTNSTGYVSVGAAVLPDPPNGFVDGLFAKAMIYNRELSDLEIKVVYRSILRRLVG